MKTHTADELAGGMRELEEQTDRGLAIIATALLEHHLAVAIEARLLPLSSKLKDNLFGSRGTLSGFQSKIDMGFALGLYTKDAHRELDTIRKIRNRFAHTPIALSFHDDPELRKLSLLLLRQGDGTLTVKQREPRERFLIAYLLLACLLYLTPQKEIRLGAISELYPHLAQEVAEVVFGASPKTP